MTVRFDEELHPVPFQSFHERAPLPHFQNDGEVWDRDILALHQMVVRDDSALLTQLRIETANDLVTIQMEVKPLLASGAFQTSEDLLVEAPSFSDISDLHAYC